jgi:molybdate transport system substrate-binding protein
MPSVAAILYADDTARASRRRGRRQTWIVAPVLAMLCCLNSTLTDAAEIHVLTAQGIEQAYREVAAAFERATGHKVTTVFTGISDAERRIRGGETYDLLVMPAQSIVPYFADGTLRPATKTDIAKSGTGLGVKAGAGRPDIATVEALKRALTRARSIGISSGPTGGYFLALIERLGIAGEIRDRIVLAPSGVFVGSMIVNGEAEIGFQQIGELSNYPGVDFVGPLPGEVQNVTAFSTGITGPAKEPYAAAALARYLTSPEALTIYAKHGMQPP